MRGACGQSCARFRHHIRRVRGGSQGFGVADVVVRLWYSLSLCSAAPMICVAVLLPSVLLSFLVRSDDCTRVSGTRYLDYFSRSRGVSPIGLEDRPLI